VRRRLPASTRVAYWILAVTDLSALPTLAGDGKRSVHVVIESPRGSALKFKYDQRLGTMMLSRPLVGGLTYPYDWGFVPSTCAPDGDPLDAIVLWDGVSFPGLVLACRPVGLLQLEQKDKRKRARERNDRLMVLPAAAPRFDSIRSVFELGNRALRELERFFLEAVAFQGKDLTILGWSGPRKAWSVIRKAQRTSKGSQAPGLRT